MQGDFFSNWPSKHLIACALPDLSNSTSFGNRNVATKIECLFKTPQNLAFPISITLFFWYETSFLSNTEMKSSSACLGLFPCIYFCLQYSTYDWLLFPELYGFLGIALLISSSLIFRAVNAYLAAVLSLSLQQVIHLKKLQCICWLSSICCSGTHHHGTNQK